MEIRLIKVCLKLKSFICLLMIRYDKSFDKCMLKTHTITDETVTYNVGYYKIWYCLIWTILRAVMRHGTVCQVRLISRQTKKKTKKK